MTKIARFVYFRICVVTATESLLKMLAKILVLLDDLIIAGVTVLSELVSILYWSDSGQYTHNEVKRSELGLIEIKVNFGKI